MVFTPRIYASHFEAVLLYQLPLLLTPSQLGRVQRFDKRHVDVVTLLRGDGHCRAFKGSGVGVLVVGSSGDVASRLDAILIEIVIGSLQVAAISKIRSGLRWSLILILERKQKFLRFIFLDFYICGMPKSEIVQISDSH